jgi:hypothetical protein
MLYAALHQICVVRTMVQCYQNIRNQLTCAIQQSFAAYSTAGLTNSTVLPGAALLAVSDYKSLKY